MKKLFISAGFLIVCLTGQAQPWNITTGQVVAAGQADPNWTLIQTPGSGAVSQSAWESNGQLYNNSTYMGSWNVPSCGQWIVPRVYTSGSGTNAAYYYEPASIPLNSAAQDYVYKYSFTNSNCCVANPRIVLSYIACDNALTFEFNGYPYTINNSFTNNSGIVNTAVNITINLNPAHFNCGSTPNVLLARVKNGGTGPNPTGLLICGSIQADPNPPTSSFTYPSSVCFGSPINVNGSSSTGTIQNHFWEIAEADANGGYANSTNVWSQWYPGAPGAFTFPSLSFMQCGKTYRIKLAVQNNCYSWVEKVHLMTVTCLPQAFAGVDKNLCPNMPPMSIGPKSSNSNYSYSWSPTIWLSNPYTYAPTLTLPSGTSCNNNTTIYTLTVTDNTTGCSNTDQVNVNYAYAAPNVNISDISPPAHNCVSNVLTPYTNCSNTRILSAGSSCSGVSYAWNTGVTGNTLTVNPTSPTNYSVTASNVCFSTMQNHTIYPCYNPTTPFYNSSTGTTTPSLYTVGNSLSVNWSGNYNGPNSNYIIYDQAYAVGAGPAYNATWYKLCIYNNLSQKVYEKEECAPCGGFWNGIISWNGICNTGPDNGSPADAQSAYSVVLELSNCADYRSGSFVMHVWDHRLAEDNGIYGEEGEIISSDLLVYPNPSDGIFTVENNVNKIENIKVFDATGRLVISKDDMALNKLTLEMNNENKGIYFVHVKMVGIEKPLYKKIIID